MTTRSSSSCTAADTISSDVPIFLQSKLEFLFLQYNLSVVLISWARTQSYCNDIVGYMVVCTTICCCICIISIGSFMNCWGGRLLAAWGLFSFLLITSQFLYYNRPRNPLAPSHSNAHYYSILQNRGLSHD